MSEIKLAQQDYAKSIDEEAAAAAAAREIRQLSELELALAGGGDGGYEWP
jgi:hypothetical protein